MPRRLLVLVALALFAGASLCIVDADEGPGPDLCGVALLPVAVLAVGALTPLVGRLVPVRMPVPLAAPLEHPVPPPRA
jgi:hypothetical protein